MKISRIAIKNFRNFRDVDIPLADHAVFVGPNDIGKSNLLHALRLVLDPSLPETMRQLRHEDFWDGLARPLRADAQVEIVVELTGFDDSDDQLASLAEYLVSAEPMVARLTYVCRPIAASGSGTSECEFFVYGGDREDSRVGYELRKRMPLDFLHALRDVASDLGAWRRSPLRPLLGGAWEVVPAAEKKRLAGAMDTATGQLTAVPSISAVEATLVAMLGRVAGPSSTSDVRLGVAPAEAESLIRILRLLVDGGRRGITDAGLGTSNVLYLTLRLLEIARLVESHERDHTIVAIEEPEAHLHPHLQRQVFRGFLRVRPHLPTGENLLDALPTTILLTTHSPHIASIAPLRSLVLLREEVVVRGVEDGGTVSATAAASAAAISLDETEVGDLERYLETTRAEMLFARGVLLVEGEAELYLAPRLAELNGVLLDRLGISVCAIGGTHFGSYAVLLTALGIPFAIVTDGDPTRGRTGIARGGELLERMGAEPLPPGTVDAEIRRRANERGIFIGEQTFEVDLLGCGIGSVMLNLLADLAPGPTARTRAEEWRAHPATVDGDRLLADIESIGKGRFAQRLAAILAREPGGEVWVGPEYLRRAIEWVVHRTSPR